ncbi:hypothetical protein BVRB_7g166390 [Beta vulgaris subsp. vulgaris]|nr:hypothetical protein BVRB_7g166390 [Beta vulgaris subsp. vulgaris]
MSSHTQKKKKNMRVIFVRCGTSVPPKYIVVQFLM